MINDKLISRDDRISMSILENRICRICPLKYGSQQCRRIDCTEEVREWISEIIADCVSEAEE